MKQAYVEIGNKCHCRCVMCNAPLYKTEEVPFDVVIERLDELHSEGYSHIRLTGREPCTHKDFVKIVDYMFRERMCVDITTTLLSSDATVIDILSYVDRLRVSLFALYHKHSIFYRTDKWGTFMENIANLAAHRRGLVKFTYTLTEYQGHSNCTELDAYKIVDFVYQTKLKDYVFEFFPDFLYIVGMPRYMQANLRKFYPILFSNGIKYKTYPIHTMNITTCNVAKNRLYVKNNGDTYPCCNAGGEIGQDLNSDMLLGNINKDTVRDMGNKVLKNLDNPTCNNCTKKFYKLMVK